MCTHVTNHIPTRTCKCKSIGESQTSQLPPINLSSPSMMRSMPFRPCGCSSALILLVFVFDPPRTNDGKMGSAFTGGIKERTMSNVLSTPATAMPMIVRSTVRIYSNTWSRFVAPIRSSFSKRCGQRQGSDLTGEEQTILHVRSPFREKSSAGSGPKQRLFGPATA